MNSESKKLLDSVLKLPAKSRATIAEKLLESLENHAVIDASIEEAERRWQAFKDGKSKGIPVEEIFPKLAEKAKRRQK